MRLVKIFHGILASGFLVACIPELSYEQNDCEVFTDLGVVRTNPAGAIERNLEVEVALRLCPPKEGVLEATRKRIELKHQLLLLLSSKTENELLDPLRVEKLQQEFFELANENVFKKSKAVEVFITTFELK